MALMQACRMVQTFKGEHSSVRARVNIACRAHGVPPVSRPLSNSPVGARPSPGRMEGLNSTRGLASAEGPSQEYDRVEATREKFRKLRSLCQSSESGHKGMYYSHIADRLVHDLTPDTS
eukprot:CAMPEP_0117674766 /NCGR_PEP_ID=MMETSP0804-20121206/15221_1 /TAXON_ID=1074897 /ORGANISM="Tetraselmis astigmatica, Strain CCMP880" /LENGTH=118 /DNA_ID=CAMNT_0005483673 /DNA_START=314 /DNA_END=670 /DNA_ORIENTATION=+